MNDETLHLLCGDLDHCEGKVPTLAEVTTAFDGVTKAFAPLIQAVREFDEQIGALGRAYCRALDTLVRPAEDPAWSWSKDAARWRPSDAMEVEP